MAPALTSPLRELAEFPDRKRTAKRSCVRLIARTKPADSKSWLSAGSVWLRVRRRSSSAGGLARIRTPHRTLARASLRRRTAQLYCGSTGGAEERFRWCGFRRENLVPDGSTLR